MTTTAASYEAAGTARSDLAGDAPASLLTTGDHKRLGVLALSLGLANLVVGLGLGVVLHLDVAGEYLRRVFNAHTTTMAMLSIAPAWAGLATYLVPLQIGARRLALPRLHAFGVWTGIAGGAGVLASYLIGAAGRSGLALSAPLEAVAGAEGSTATQLWIVSLGLVALGALSVAIDLVATVLTQRARGMTLARVPAFSWSVLVTGAALVLATPTFLAGLALLYVDQRHGGTFFDQATRGTSETWRHLLWIYGRPELWLLGIPALGALSDIVATHARRPLINHVAALGLIAAAGVATFGAWAADSPAARAVILPTHSIATVLIGAPVGLLVLMWLGTLRKGTPHVHPALAGTGAFIALLAMAAMNAGVAATQDVDHSQAFALAQVTATTYGPATVALLAALVHWAPKLSGRLIGSTAALGGIALAFVGAALAALAGWITGYAGWSGATATAPAAGYLLMAVGVLSVASSLASDRSGSAPVAGDDPYEGHTLEWATTSPPPPHNFDALPEVRSATPLADERVPVSEGIA